MPKYNKFQEDDEPKIIYVSILRGSPVGYQKACYFAPMKRSVIAGPTNKTDKVLSFSYTIRLAWNTTGYRYERWNIGVTKSYERLRSKRDERGRGLSSIW